MSQNMAEIVTAAWACAFVCVLLVLSYLCHEQD